MPAIPSHQNADHENEEGFPRDPNSTGGKTMREIPARSACCFGEDADMHNRFNDGNVLHDGGAEAHMSGMAVDPVTDYAEDVLGHKVPGASNSCRGMNSCGGRIPGKRSRRENP